MWPLSLFHALLMEGVADTAVAVMAVAVMAAVDGTEVMAVDGTEVTAADGTEGVATGEDMATHTVDTPIRILTGIGQLSVIIMAGVIGFGCHNY